MTPGINPEKRNIFHVELPYFYLRQGAKELEPGEKPWVIFWGINFRNHPEIYKDEKELIRRINLCLDYIRRECAGCRLLYKMHPHETDEPSLLDLTGFEVLKEKTVAEFFVFRNFHKVKYVFSSYSSATVTLFWRGLNSYNFLPVIEPAMTDERVISVRDWFKSMGVPSEFFISDLSQKLCENKINISDNIDPVLRENLARLLGENKGTAWFILTDPGALTLAISLRGAIRSLSPERRVGLIVERHHRWDVMNMDQVREYFDEVKIYRRELWSLRPYKILNKLKIARLIKKTDIHSDDIFISLNPGSFIDDCFISYFHGNKSIVFFSKDSVEHCFGKKDPAFFGNYHTRFRVLLPVIFSHRVLEPLLGLHRTIYMVNPVMPSSWGRYSEAINDIYDQVYTY